MTLADLRIGSFEYMPADLGWWALLDPELCSAAISFDVVRFSVCSASIWVALCCGVLRLGHRRVLSCGCSLLAGAVL